MNIIRKKRIMLKLSQKNLALKCNLTQGFISKIENYYKYPTIPVILVISKKLYLCPVLIFKNYICKNCSYRKNCKCKF